MLYKDGLLHKEILLGMVLLVLIYDLDVDCLGYTDGTGILCLLEWPKRILGRRFLR